MKRILAILLFISPAAADTPMTCQEQVSYLKDVVRQLGGIAEAYRLQAEATAVAVVVPRMKPKAIRERIKPAVVNAGPCGSRRQVWYTRAGGRKMYRCR